MNLILAQIPSLIDALLNMDGTKEKPAKYTTKVRYDLAKNLRLLNKRFEDMEKVRTGLIREIDPDTFSIKPNTPEMVEYTSKWEEFVRQEEEIGGLKRFTLADLNLETNELPIAVLAKLGPLLIEDDEVIATVK